MPSRPHLEWQLRRRVRDIDNVTILRRSVAEPRFDSARQRVTGVVLDPKDEVGDEPEFVQADLVVDAAGRGTRLPVWLTQWGYQRPIEETLDIGINYASHQFRIPEGLIAEKVVVAGASHDQSLGMGMLCYEDGTWVLTTFGVAGTKPPTTFPDMVALAIELLPAHFTEALTHARPVGAPAFHAFPASKWRRYDKLDRFPAGIIPLGDAVASFNPTFGQGMTMTSLQAGHLRRALRSADEDLAGELNRATAKTTYPVWTMNAIGDVAFHHAGTSAPIPWWWRPSGRCSTNSSARPRPNPFSPNGFCAASRCSTVSIWFRRRGSSAGPSRTTCGCGCASAASRVRPPRGGPSQTYGRPEQLRRLVRDQPHRSVVGRNPGRHPAVQRQRPGFAVHDRGTLGTQQDLRTVLDW